MTAATDKALARTAMTGLVLEVFRLNGNLLATGDALVADLGLTSARWQVLGAVARAPEPLPVAHLARNIGVTRQAVQRLVDEMKKDGFVRQAPNPNHRRADLVLLTDRGLAAYRAAMARQVRWVEDLANGFVPRSVKAASNLLVEVRRRLEVATAGLPDGRSTRRRVVRQDDRHPEERTTYRPGTGQG